MKTDLTQRLGFMGAAALALAGLIAGATTASGQVPMDNDDISGEVRGPTGPEAGVWVIAETNDLDTRFRKIVVTDTMGRYLLPDLPDATYDIWVRGYGLTDSTPSSARPGMSLTLQAVPAADAQEAAQVYPANYWYSLVEVPREDEFPGTGDTGNGISPCLLYTSPSPRD